MRLLPRTLLNRVFVLYGVTLGVLLFGGLAAFLREDFYSEIANAQENADTTIEIAAQAVRDSAVVNDLDSVRRTLQTAVLRSPYARASYFDVGGTAYHVDAPTRPTTAAPRWLSRLVQAELVDVNRVISVGGRDYGVLRLKFQIERITEPLWHAAQQAVMLGLLGLACGLALTRWLLGRWLSNLDQLGNYAEQIRKGHLDIRATASEDAPAEVRRTLELFNSAASGLRDQFGQRIDALAYALVQHKRATDQAVIVLELDAEGRVTAVNDLFCAVSGFTRSEFTGRDPGWGLKFERYRDTARSSGAALPWAGEVACTRRDGVVVWVKRHVVPIRAEDGQVEKYICLDIDITREKDAERTLIEQKERAEVTLHSIADGVITTDGDQCMTYANPAALRILHLDGQRIEGRRIDDVMKLGPFAAQGSRRGAMLCSVVLLDGGRAMLEVQSEPLHDASGRATGEVMAFRDVTAEQRTQQELQRMSLAVRHAASAIMITDANGRIEYVNPKFTQMTGFEIDEIRGQTPRFLKSGQEPQTTYDAMWQALRVGRTWRGELYNRRKDGSTLWCVVTLSAVCDRSGRATQFVSVMEDASERKRAQETIHKLAYYDALTDLPNRRMFMERAVQAVKTARVDKSALAVCYFDLDGFKHVNDTLGHQAGDALLSEVARRIKGCLSERDFIGRLGGDEFAALMVGAGDPEHIAQAGRQIIAELERPVMVDGQALHISTSIGVSMFPDDGQDVADLLRKADMALYQAKESGKRRMAFFTSEIEARKRQRSELEAAMREAVPRGQLQLVYQPKIDIRSKAVVGAEALLRWQHPERGLVRPDDFIPLAEETRLIVPIGRWVIEQSCRQIQRWREAGLTEANVAVNISSVQFRAPNLVDDIERIVRETGIDPARLELEITESGLMEDPDGVARTLERLRAIGLTIAIDDFGTGYSSLAYLKSFPVSVLKIDRSFVRDLETDHNDRGIAEAVISMAKVLKVQVVAEGVETRGQMEVLEAMGCQLAQGFYFSRPLNPEQFVGFWWRHRPQQSYQPTDVGAVLD